MHIAQCVLHTAHPTENSLTAAHQFEEKHQVEEKTPVWRKHQFAQICTFIHTALGIQLPRRMVSTICTKSDISRQEAPQCLYICAHSANVYICAQSVNVDICAHSAKVDKRAHSANCAVMVRVWGEAAITDRIRHQGFSEQLLNNSWNSHTTHSTL